MEAVVYNCFLRKLVQLRHTDVTSFSMQFEKEDVDNWGKLSRVRVVCWLKARRGKRIFSGLILSLCPPCFQPTNDSPLLRKASHTNQLPLFSNCMQNDVTLVQWPVSAKKQSVYYWSTLYLSYFYCPNQSIFYQSNHSSLIYTFQAWISFSIKRWKKLLFKRSKYIHSKSTMI